MICAIHMFSGTQVTQWMDNIIVPSLRRETLLKRLGYPISREKFNGNRADLTPFDEKQISQQKEQVEEAIKVMMGAFPDMEDA